MRKSIFGDDKRCYLCGSTVNLEKHHIYFGNPLRKISDKHGFVTWLCSYHHRDQKNGVHGSREVDLKLKQDCQRKFEETHSREEWMEIIGKNYL